MTHEVEITDDAGITDEGKADLAVPFRSESPWSEPVTARTPPAGWEMRFDANEVPLGWHYTKPRPEDAFRNAKGEKPLLTVGCPGCGTWLAGIYRAVPRTVVNARLATPDGPLKAVQMWLRDVDVFVLDHCGQQYKITREWMTHRIGDRPRRVPAPGP